MNNVIISPSILAADFSDLSTEIAKLNNTSCEWIHFDVMDGHFVNNITFGPQLIKSLRMKSTKVFDVHLMMDYPLDYLEEFVNAGCDYISIHVEATQVKQLGLRKSLELIKSYGVKAGLVIQPDTDPSVLLSVLDYCDLVLIMSVYAGFGGQTFIEHSLNKIVLLKELAFKYNPNLLISVDGGINNITSKKCIEAGANVLIAGSYIFNGEYASKVDELR